MQSMTPRVATAAMAALFAMFGLAACSSAPDRTPPPVTTQANDSDGPTTRELVAMQMDDYREQLDLSEYKWTQVEQILKSGIRERVAIARRYGFDGTFDHYQAMDRKQKKQLAKDLKDSRKNTAERMKRYLDKDQYKAFEALQEDIHDEIVARVEAASRPGP